MMNNLKSPKDSEKLGETLTTLEFSQPVRDSGESRYWKAIFSKSSTLAVACALAQAAIGYDSNISAIVPREIITPKSLLAAENAAPDGIGIPMSGSALAKWEVLRVIYSIALVFGAILTFFVGDILGRKTNVAVGALLNGVGSIVQSASYGPPAWIAGRVIAGIGAGLNVASSAVWQVEVSDIHFRGRLVLLQLAGNAAGQVIANWLSTAYTGVYGPPTGVSWRLPMGIQMVFVLGLFVLLPMLPESPQWLVRKGRLEEAKITIAKIKSRSIDDAVVQREYNHLVAPTNEYVYHTPQEQWQNLRTKASQQNPDAQELAAKPSRKKWRRAMMGLSLQILYVWSGLYMINYVNTVIFTNSGATNALSATLGLLGQTIFFLGIVSTMLFVEPLGRRKGLIMAFLGQGVCCVLVLILSFTLTTASRTNTSAAAKIGYTIGALGIIFNGFAGMVSCLTFLYQVEINTWTFRIAGSAIASAGLYVNNFAAGYTVFAIVPYPHVWAAILVGANVLAIAFVYLFCPETGSRSLKSLDDHFANHPPMLVCRHKYLTKVSWTTENEESHQTSIQD